MAVGERGAVPIYGVAIWRNIDPRVARFRVFLSGFSNGFRKVQGPDGLEVVLRRTLVIDFWRPGDEFNVREPQFQIQGDPTWLYLPDDVEKTPTAANPTNGNTALPAPNNSGTGDNNATGNSSTGNSSTGNN